MFPKFESPVYIALLFFSTIFFIKYVLYTNPPQFYKHTIHAAKHVIHDVIPDVITGEWVGNTYVFNDTRVHYLNWADIQHVLNHKNILFLGDSLTRRLAQTVALLYTKEFITSNEINKDRFTHGKLVIHASKLLNITYFYTPFFHDIVKHVPTFSDYTHIICSIGDHEKFHKDTWYQQFQLLHNRIQHDEHNIIWRTEPLPNLPSNALDLLHLYQNISQTIKNNYKHVLDHQYLAHHKDLGNNRDKGNTNEHFGPNVRLAIAMSLLNYLKYPSIFETP